MTARREIAAASVRICEARLVSAVSRLDEAKASHAFAVEALKRAESELAALTVKESTDDRV